MYLSNAFISINWAIINCVRSQYGAFHYTNWIHQYTYLVVRVGHRVVAFVTYIYISKWLSTFLTGDCLYITYFLYKLIKLYFSICVSHIYYTYVSLSLSISPPPLPTLCRLAGKAASLSFHVSPGIAAPGEILGRCICMDWVRLGPKCLDECNSIPSLNERQLYSMCLCFFKTVFIIYSFYNQVTTVTILENK